MPQLAAVVDAREGERTDEGEEGGRVIAPRPTEVSFSIPGNPVSHNRAWTIITWKPRAEAAARGAQPHASMKLTKEGAEFKVAVARAVALHRPNEWDRENEYIVEACYFFESRRPDVDGPGKLLLDALADFELELHRGHAMAFTGLFSNDRRVWKFTQQRELDAENPRAEITVKLRYPWRPQQRGLLG